jgi:hypothetical protein
MAKIITPLLLQYVDGKIWTLAEDFIVESSPLGIIRIAKGFRTDFNSIPRGLWNILPPDEAGHAAVVHDHLYQTGRIVTRNITRSEADAAHREFAQLDGIKSWKIGLIYSALRLGGWKVWNRYRALDSPA